MKQSNRGIWIVIGLGVVAAAGFVLVHKLVLAPREANKAIRDEVERWGSKWKQARECLVGSKPHASNGFDAIILREAIDGAEPPELRRCVGHFRRLSRPGSTQSGKRKVEQAWLDLESAVGKLANAHALRIDRKSIRATGERRDRLGQALEEVDRIYATLRSAAGMKPITYSGRASIPTPKGIVIAAGKRPIPPETADVFGSTVLVQGALDGTTTIAEVTGPDAIATAMIATGVKRGPGPTSWGVWVADKSLRAGELDAAGKPKGDGVVVATSDKAKQLDSAFVLSTDDGKQRVIVYRRLVRRGTAIEWMVAQSRDSGATWRSAPVLPAGGRLDHTGRDWAQRRLDLVYKAEDGSRRWATVTATMPWPPTAVAFPEFWIHGRCAAGAATWWLDLDGGAIHRADKGRIARVPIALEKEEAKLLDCKTDRALVGGRDPGKLSICDAKACKALPEVPHAEGADVKATLAGDTVLAATVSNELLVAWKIGAKEPLAVLRVEGSKLRGVVAWPAGLFALVTDEERARLIPISEIGGKPPATK